MTVMPPGGKVGSSVEVTFTGTDLEEPEQLLFSHPGIKAEPLAAPEPPAAPARSETETETRYGMGKPVVSRFKVTLAADVPLGIHDVRFVNKWGVSNPRAFVAGDLNEVLEKEPNNDVEQAQRVELNSTVNGSMANPADVDYYVFAGKKGQRVVFSCLASSIDSRFHAGLEVYDSKGKQLASGRDYNDTDAVTDCTLPDDGDYYVRLFHFTHTEGTCRAFLSSQHQHGAVDRCDLSLRRRSRQDDERDRLWPQSAGRQARSVGGGRRLRAGENHRQRRRAQRRRPAPGVHAAW